MAMQYVNGGWREPLSQAEPSDAHLMEDDLLDASLYEQLGTLIAGEQGDIYALCCSNSEGSGSSTSKPSISRHRAVEAPGLYNTPQEWGSRCARRAIAACTYICVHAGSLVLAGQMRCNCRLHCHRQSGDAAAHTAVCVDKEYT